MELIGLSKERQIHKQGADGYKVVVKQSEILIFYRYLKLFRLFIFLSPLLFTSSTLAQNPPPGQEAGPQAERFKATAEREKKQFEQKKAKAPEIEIKKEEEKKPAVEEISFILKEVKVTGSTIFKSEDFSPFYMPYLNKKVTFQDLDAIAAKIKDMYKQKGYVTTLAYIPEQDIKQGSIEIKVVEGKMGRLTVEGNKWFKTSFIEKYFHLKKNEIIQIRKLQRDLLRLNQNSDLEVKTVLSPGAEPETSDIVLQVKDKFPWHVGTSFDNQGTRLTGKLRSALYFRSTNATGNGDSFFVNTLYSSLTMGNSLSYTIPLGTYGTKLGLDATYFRMKIGKEFKTSEITGRTQIYTPHISWELALSEFFSANTDVGLDIKCIQKKADGTLTASDQLRIPYFNFDFTGIDSFGQTSFSPKFNFGTSNFLGASSRNHTTAGRANTCGFFFKYEQYLKRIQRMPFKSYLTIQSQFQVATHTLPSAEQFQLGGENSIRGYPEGDYLADIGGNLKLDWNLSPDWTFPFSFIPASWKLPYSDIPLRSQIEPIVFMDIGGGKLKTILSGERPYKILMGAGGGFRLRLYNKAYLKFEWAKSMGGGRPTSGSGPSTFYISFQAEAG